MQIHLQVDYDAQKKPRMVILERCGDRMETEGGLIACRG